MISYLLKELSLIRELWRRLSAKTPHTLQKVQKRAALTALSIGGMIGSGHMPDAALPYLKCAALFFGAVAAGLQLACETPPSTPNDSQSS